MGDEQVTLWSLMPLPGAVPAASYLTGPLASQYRLIVDILDDQRRISLTGVGFEELQTLLAQRLPEEQRRGLLQDFPLEARMSALVGWGTCESWQDSADNQADFLRNRYRYQLTDAGSAINAAVRKLERDLGSTSTAVLLAPASIVARLSEMLTALDDPERASREFAQVQTTLEAMGAAASEWQSRLAAALGGSPTEVKVRRLLETILAYVDAWGSGVDAWSDDIAATLPELNQIPDSTWRAMVLARLGADAAEPAVAKDVEEMRVTVATIETWFSGPDPQASRLRRQIRDAVVPVLRSHRTLLAVGGTVSRKADLLRLAAAIESAEDDQAAWQLWCSATGLYPARHFTMPTPEVSGGSRMSVWDAPPAVISRRLRAQATRSLTGRPTHVVDNSAARAEARRIAAREAADVERAGANLVVRSGTSLGEWGELDDTEAKLLLDLIAIARNNRSADGTLRGVSADGRWRLTLHPRPGSAVLHTAQGRLVLPDARVEFGT